MKIPRLLTCLSLLALAPAEAIAQHPQQLPNPVAGGGRAPQPVVERPAEKPFTLDFAGGPVQVFVKSVEMATNEPFNVIIPEHAQDLQIPPVSVREVTLSPLLSALSAASRESKPVAIQQNAFGGRSQMPLNGSFEYRNTGFTFTPTPGAGGSVVWQLLVEKAAPLPEPPPPPRVPPVARFYQLKPNLEAGLKVEDVTTVALTAWKMMKLDVKEIPELKVHEETGLLIAVGSETALSVIDSILRELPKKDSGGTIRSVPPIGVPGPQPSPPRAR